MRETGRTGRGGGWKDHGKGAAVETFLQVGLGNALAAGLLALGAAAVGVFARRRPALRHGLWLLVLLKLVTPPLWSVPVARVAGRVEARAEPAPAPAPASERTRPGSEDAPTPAPALLPEDGPETGTDAAQEAAPVVSEPDAPQGRSWGWPVLAVWAGGSLLTFGVAARRIRRFQRLLGLAEPASEATRAEVEALAGRLGLGRAPVVWRLPGAVSPMVWALGCRPRLIVPSRLWDRLDETQRATLLAHELAHLRRRDHWVRGLELLVTGLYWWLPVVWMARHALREAEEQCCDAWVVWALPDATRTYAEALLETLDFLSGAGPAAAVAASGLGPVHHLKRRMTMIMQGTTPRSLTGSGLLTVLGLSATLLPLSPTWAQRPDDEEAPAPAVAPEKPATRDPGDRPDGADDDGDREQQDAKTPKPRVRIFRSEGREARDDPGFDKIDQAVGSAVEEWLSAQREASEALRDLEAKYKAKLKELKDRKPGEPLDERSREELEVALQRFRDFAKSFRPPVPPLPPLPPLPPSPERLQEKARTAREPLPKIAQREQEDDESTSKRENPEAARDKREAEERRAEVKRLREEVESRRKALIESEMRLAKAIKELTEAGEAPRTVTRNERFEVRITKPGPVPARPGMVKIVPRSDQERRISELEEKLEKLMDEVKKLKKDEPARK